MPTNTNVPWTAFPFLWAIRRGSASSTFRWGLLLFLETIHWNAQLRRRTAAQGRRSHLAINKRWFHPHTRILEHVRPFPRRTRVAMLEMLSEVICTIEFFCLVTFAKPMKMVQVFCTSYPVDRIRRELFTTIAARIRWRTGSCWTGGKMKDISGIDQSRTGPWMTT